MLNDRNYLHPPTTQSRIDQKAVILNNLDTSHSHSATEAAEAAERGNGIEPVLRNRVRQIRVAKFMSLRELAKKAKISKDTLNNIENGSTTNPDHSTMFKIASALGVEPKFDVYVMDEELRRIVEQSYEEGRVEEEPVNDFLPMEFVRMMPRQTTKNTIPEIIKKCVEYLDDIGKDITAKNVNGLVEPYLQTKKANENVMDAYYATLERIRANE